MDSGEKWSKQHRKISAFDFQTAPHKSVTLAAEFAKAPAEAAAIWHAMDRANDATMAEIQSSKPTSRSLRNALHNLKSMRSGPGQEIERLRAHVTRLTARVREFEAGAEAERVAVLDNVRRILGGDDDLPLG